ncbi:endonuclease domain-containing protein [Variibacter gotjawalensis]|uniref:endonuclease domain-containing protein n=1 Tax=Variibacter gotjawalensis TaxID=1333996 RepID=UPI0032216BCB
MRCGLSLSRLRERVASFVREANREPGEGMLNGQKRDSARSLRRDSTEAERRLWWMLRDRRFAGIKFRRQVPIGPFVADFACICRKLIIEVDGGHHANSASDARRDTYLRAEGWHIIRFWNNDVLSNREGVWLTLEQAICPHPNPLPQAGEGV